MCDLNVQEERENYYRLRRSGLRYPDLEQRKILIGSAGPQGPASRSDLCKIRCPLGLPPCGSRSPCVVLRRDWPRDCGRARSAPNLELLHEPFNSMQKTAEYFNVDYRSILRHLDTKLATRKDGQLVLPPHRQRSCLGKVKRDIFNNLKRQRMKRLKYEFIKNIDNELVLINSNEPTYNSIYTAAKELKMSHKTINKYLDTNKYRETTRCFTAISSISKLCKLTLLILVGECKKLSLALKWK